MKTSKFLSLDLRDLLKGALMAVLGAVFGLIQTSLESGSLNFDWGHIAKTAVIVGGLYIIKNFFTNSNDEFGRPEPS